MFSPLYYNIDITKENKEEQRMFDVITKYGNVVYTGTKKACWRYCEENDRYATWEIVKHR